MNVEVDPIRLLQLFTIVAIAIGIAIMVFMPGGVLGLLTQGVVAGIDARWPVTGAALMLVGGFGMIFRRAAEVVAKNRILLTDDGEYVVCPSMFTRRAFIVRNAGVRDMVVRSIARREAWRPLLPLVGFGLVAIFFGWIAGIVFAVACEASWVLLQHLAFKNPVASLDEYHHRLSFSEVRRGQLRLMNPADCQAQIAATVLLAAIPGLLLGWSAAVGGVSRGNQLVLATTTLGFAAMALLVYRRSRWRMTDPLACHPPPLPPTVPG